MNPKDIIRYAKELKETRRTSNPFVIAEYFGIHVTFQENCRPGFTAQTTKIENYPTYITINDAYTPFSKKILCAHELAHALLHSETLNCFANTSKNVHTEVEKDANLFAITLLTDDSFENGLPLSLASMDNYTLKSIVDYNLHFKE